MTVEEMKILQPVISDDELFERMSLGEQLQHGILVICFITLVLTGLPIFTWTFSV